MTCCFSFLHPSKYSRLSLPLCEGELNQQRLPESAGVSQGSGGEEATCAVLVALVGLMSPQPHFLSFSSSVCHDKCPDP